MPLTDLLVSQLTDVFRVGMIVALIATTLRTEAVTGRLIPLLAGILFVAVIIPLTLQTGSPVPLVRSIFMGIIANLVLLGIAWAGWTLLRRLTGK